MVDGDPAGELRVKQCILPQGECVGDLPVQSLRTQPAMVHSIHSAPSHTYNLTVLDANVHTTAIATPSHGSVTSSFCYCVLRVQISSKLPRTCIVHMRFVPICQAPPYTSHPLELAIHACMVFSSPICPRSHREFGRRCPAS
jgi:hypothetical protein